MRWPAAQPELVGEHLVLRPWRPSDADQVWQACQDEVIQRYTTVPVPYRREDAEHFVGTVGAGSFAARTGAGFAVTKRRNALLLGACGLIRIDPLPAVAADTKVTASAQGTADAAAERSVGYAGYWIAPWARGQRAAAGAMRLLADWALSELGLAAVRLEIEPANVGSVRTAALAGFTPVPGPPVQQPHRGETRWFAVFERTS